MSTFDDNEAPVYLQAWMDHSTEIAGNRYEWATEFAIDAICSGGMDADSRDALGTEVGDQLQTLLMMLAVRCPELAAQITTSEPHFTPEAIEWSNS